MCAILFLSYASFETQRNGLVFIYDMAGSHYTNFELDLSKKILNLLKVKRTENGGVFERIGSLRFSLPPVKSSLSFS